MFAYYLRLALISSAKTPITSALMVCAIAVGIGACMAFVNFSYLLAQDPIPHKSDVLYAVQLDAGSPHAPAGGKPPPQLTYMDASALMRERRAHRQAAMARTRLVVEPQGADARPFEAASRATYADFFTMFDVPFLFGGPWDAQADDRALRVVVLSRATNDRLFGGEDSVGRRCVLNGNEFSRDRRDRRVEANAEVLRCERRLGQLAGGGVPAVRADGGAASSAARQHKLLETLRRRHRGVSRIRMRVDTVLGGIAKRCGKARIPRIPG